MDSCFLGLTTRALLYIVLYSLRANETFCLALLIQSKESINKGLDVCVCVCGFGSNGTTLAAYYVQCAYKERFN